MPSVLNPSASLTGGRQLNTLLGGRAMLNVVFGQHSTESAVCCLGVWYICRRGGFIIGLGGPCCRFHGSSYLLRAIFKPNLFLCKYSNFS